jgi:ABC-type branched-subunit amino acid transport system substrate-binding protein
MAIISDTLWHSAEWVEFLRLRARRLGVQIVGEERINAPLISPSDPSEEQMVIARRAVARLQSTAPDVVAVASALGTTSFIKARHEAAWEVPVVCNGSFGPSFRRGFGEAMQDWVGCILHDEENPVAAAFFDAYEKRWGEPIEYEDLALSAYDACRSLLEGLSLAPHLSREGVRIGIERVKLLPAATGAASTVITFGPWDHRGLKGRDFSILKQVKGDRLVPAGHFTGAGPLTD